MSPRQAVPTLHLELSEDYAWCLDILPHCRSGNKRPREGCSPLLTLWISLLSQEHPLPRCSAHSALPTLSCPWLSASTHQGTLSAFQADQIVFVDSDRSTEFKLTFGQQNPMRPLHFSKSDIQVWAHTPEGGTRSALWAFLPIWLKDQRERSPSWTDTESKCPSWELELNCSKRKVHLSQARRACSFSWSLSLGR